MNSREASLFDTIDHIQKVQWYLAQIIENLQSRALMHDKSKLMPPELDGYAGLADAVKGFPYGTDEYRAAFEPFKKIIRHHYDANDHHPEHFQDNDIRRMNLLQVVEMVTDWKAASTRRDDTLLKSLDVSFKRFGIDDQLAWIIRNTINDLEW